MTIRYGPFARFSDWWHGWRDGAANIPERPPRRPRPADGEPPHRYDVTTPHREYLIRMAQDGFDHERLAMEAGLVEAGKRLESAKARLDGVVESLARVDTELVDASRPLTAAEATSRRVAEGHRTEQVVRTRREREHNRRIAPVQRRRQTAQRGVDDAVASVAAAQDEVARHHAVARVRVDRIHQHAQRRIAAYRRRLVISHPEGPWINRVLGVLDPHLPGWATEGAEDEISDPIAQDIPDPEDPGDPPEPWQVLLGDETTFGAGPGVDHTIDFYYAAPRHFALRRDGTGYLLVDFEPTNGPYIDGTQVRRALLAPGKGFDFGHHAYRISDDGTMLERAPFAPGELVVHKLSAVSGKTPRLSEMSMVQRNSTVLAILGPSGAGKTSLFYALMGELDLAKGGDFYYANKNVLENGAQMRTLLGFVPQDDNLHRTMTVEKLLLYSDRLRRPQWRRDRRTRIDEVCKQLQIESRRDRIVGTLSGGQRKRVSIALELLARPPLLMLDEPTSGLDSGMDRDVMELLKTYAAGGNLVIVITHTIQHLYLAQQMLILGTQGRPVFLGEPAAALPALQVAGYADLMKLLGSDSTEDRDRVTVLANKYATGPMEKYAGDEIARIRRESSTSPPFKPVQAWRSIGRFWQQLPVLMGRQVALMVARGSAKNSTDRRWHERIFTPIIALLPLIVAIGGALVAAGVAHAGALNSPTGAVGTLSLLITLSMLAGQALTYSDVVSEYHVIKREHRTGAVTAAVMVSKWLVFAVAAIVQAALITTVFIWLKGAPEHSNHLPPATELFVDLAAMTVAAMTLGLLISTIASKVEQAVNWSTFLAIGQIALNGAAADLSHGGIASAISDLLPARWGVAIAASSIDVRGISRGAPADALWRHTSGQWATDLVWLGSVTVVLFVVALLWLGRKLNRPD